jgi:hypothetical protein
MRPTSRAHNRSFPTSRQGELRTIGPSSASFAPLTSWQAGRVASEPPSGDRSPRRSGCRRHQVDLGRAARRRAMRAESFSALAPERLGEGRLGGVAAQVGDLSGPPSAGSQTSSRRSGRATRSSRPGAARRSGRGRPRRPRVSGRSARRGCPRAPTRSSSCAASGSRPAPVNRTSTCWPAWWTGQPGTSKTKVFACGVSTRTSTSSASRQVSRPGSAVPAWVTVVVVAVRLPEAGLVARGEPQAAHPLGALPEVVVIDERARRATVLGRERLTTGGCDSRGSRMQIDEVVSDKHIRGAGRSGQRQPWHPETLAGASTGELDADRGRL